MHRPMLLLRLLLLLLLMQAATAQESGPPRPAGFIYDDARLFDDAKRAELAQLLERTKAESGVAVMLATFTYTSGTTINQRAQQLATTWLGAEPGMIFAFDRGSSQPAITVSPGLWARYPADDLTMLVLRASRVLTRPPPVADQRLAEAVADAAAGLSQLEAQRLARQQPFTRDDRTFAATALITLAGLGLLAIWGSKRLRHRREELHETFTFPDVEVGMRLGAPYGGGTSAEVAGRKSHPSPPAQSS